MTDPWVDTTGFSVMNGGTLSFNGTAWDPAPSVQGTAPTSGAITSTVAGNSSVVFSGGAAATATITPGTQLVLTGATTEVAYVSSQFKGGSSATVPLTNSLSNAGNTTANWTFFSAAGAGAGAFYGMGVPVAAAVAYDTATGKVGLVRNGGGDATAVGNVAAAGSAVFNGTTWDRQRSVASDAQAATGIAFAAGAVYNGATYDRQRSNTATSLLASTAQSTAYTSAAQLNVNAAMAHIIVNVTAVSGTAPTLVIGIDGQDVASSVWYNLLTSASITATGTYVFRVGPGFTPVANSAVNDMLPRTWRVTGTLGGTTPSFTMSIGYNLNE